MAKIRMYGGDEKGKCKALARAEAKGRKGRIIEGRIRLER